MINRELTFRILADVGEERERQEQLKLEGKFRYTCADSGPTDVSKLAVLAEEFGEVSKLVCENLIRSQNGTKLLPRINLREELIQVAAVAVAWAEALSVPK